MQNGPEHNKIFDGGCILAQNAVKYSLTYTKKLSVSAGAHKPLPLGEVSPKVTERARTLTEKHRHSDRIALTKSLPIAVCRLCRAGLALSGASRQLSQRESPWQAGFDRAGRLRHNMAQKGGPCAQT